MNKGRGHGKHLDQASLRVRGTASPDCPESRLLNRPSSAAPACARGSVIYPPEAKAYSQLHGWRPEKNCATARIVSLSLLLLMTCENNVEMGRDFIFENRRLFCTKIWCIYIYIYSICIYVGVKLVYPALRILGKYLYMWYFIWSCLFSLLIFMT